ncbi:transaldolase family protein [Calidithermus timidus]|jgi:transaldolase|uniref:transaldolase family protein n=1 Tax=Calidithermus timidus TaxID=307124 RepID=UPI00037737BB|nr:transaldolase family protein [Calidithermus timidus]
MRLYLDTADRHLAEPLLRTGLFWGVTTNPLLLQAVGLKTAQLPELYAWATDLGAKEVFFQGWGPDAESLVARGLELRSIGERVVVKLPVTQAGCQAASELLRQGCAVLLTAIYTPAQALLGAAAGVQYIAPYLGRIADAGRNARAEVALMQRLLKELGNPTQILLASLRHLDDVVAMSQEGVRAFTLNPAVARQFFEEPLTEEAVIAFEQAMKEVVA